MKKISIIAIVASFIFAQSAFAVTQNAVYESHTGNIYPSSGTIVNAVAVPDDGLFVQMGAGSTITMVFPGNYVAAPDGTSAADLQINIFDALFSASAEVFVSMNGTTWTDLGLYSDTANIDLDLTGSAVKYVKLDQNGYYIDPAYPDLGFDLDAVVALNAVDATADTDSDGVVDISDLCPTGTTADTGTWLLPWGTNRWQVQDGNQWYQNKPGPKNTRTATWGYDIGYTYGCNGHQILTMLNNELGNVMTGHWKYGLSSSVLQEFHQDLSDGVLDGMYYLETVTVPANDTDGVTSIASLENGKAYKFKASGTANAGDGIEFDADYSFRTPSSVAWTDAVSTYESYGDTLLDLMVNGGFVNWGSAFDPSHTYSYNMTGTGAPVTFGVNDVYYPNNTGNLTVDIYAQI